MDIILSTPINILQQQLPHKAGFKNWQIGGILHSTLQLLKFHSTISIILWKPTGYMLDQNFNQ